MQLKITKKLVTELENRRLYLRPFFHFEGALDKVLFVKNKVYVEQYARIPEASLTWNEPVTIGAFSYIVQGSMLEGCNIGRFCSIATGVRVMSEGHPTDRITTSTISYGSNVFDLIKKDFGVEIMQNRKIAKSPSTVIEHDVWIGENATIKRGITIGVGSIVAGSSVVVKDVPPYAIVGGNPAKLIRYRFSEDIIERLINSKWWDLHPSCFANLDFSDIDGFLTGLPENKMLSDYESYELGEIFNEFSK